jgi:WD40 repeat protein
MASFTDEKRQSPDDITCNEQIFDIDFHPNVNCVAVGMIDGTVSLYKYGNNNGDNTSLMSSKLHDKSCRGVLFSENGDHLYSISSDKSIIGFDGTGTKVLQIDDAHDDPINKCILLSGLGRADGTMIATGDDSGCVKIWDTRISDNNNSPMSWKIHEDFISGLCYNHDASTLLSVSGDGTLCAYDIRKSTNSFRSDEQESELLCVQCIKGGKKVICGTQDGVILIFSWGRWGDCSDRYPGHPNTIDCMLKIDESTIFTGSSDGLVRVVALQPNMILGVVGDHEDFPVEGIKTTNDRRLLGSFAHDEVLRFWDISMFADDDDNDIDNEEEQAIEMDEDDDNDKDDTKAEEMENDDTGEEDGDNKWEDMSESSEFDSGSSDDDEPKKPNQRHIPTASEKFFADL